MPAAPHGRPASIHMHLLFTAYEELSGVIPSLNLNVERRKTNLKGQKIITRATSLAQIRK